MYLLYTVGRLIIRTDIQLFFDHQNEQCPGFISNLLTFHPPIPLLSSLSRLINKVIKRPTKHFLKKRK